MKLIQEVKTALCQRGLHSRYVIASGCEVPPAVSHQDREHQGLRRHREEVRPDPVHLNLLRGHRPLHIHFSDLSSHNVFIT